MVRHGEVLIRSKQCLGLLTEGERVFPAAMIGQTRLGPSTAHHSRPPDSVKGLREGHGPDSQTSLGGLRLAVEGVNC